MSFADIARADARYYWAAKFGGGWWIGVDYVLDDQIHSLKVNQAESRESAVKRIEELNAR